MAAEAECTRLSSQVAELGRLRGEVGLAGVLGADTETSRWVAGLLGAHRSRRTPGMCRAAVQVEARAADAEAGAAASRNASAQAVAELEAVRAALAAAEARGTAGSAASAEVERRAAAAAAQAAELHARELAALNGRVAELTAELAERVSWASAGTCLPGVWDFMRAGKAAGRAGPPDDGDWAASTRRRRGPPRAAPACSSSCCWRRGSWSPLRWPTRHRAPPLPPRRR